MVTQQSAPGRAGRYLVRALDAWLRRSQGSYAFSEAPDCILRLSPGRAKGPMHFADGTTVAPGEPLLILHFWNERLPQVPPEGPDLRWGRTMIRQALASLRLLARYLADEPRLADVRAVGSDLAGFLTATALDTGAVFPRLGFEMQRPRGQAGAAGRFVEFWQNVYSWLLVWTYNPATMRGKTPWTLERFGLWMSRATLEQRYGSGAAPDVG